MRPRPYRRVLVGALCLAITLAACGGQGDGPRTNLTLYNDKGGWTDFFQQMGQESKKQIGLSMEPVGYTDEATYQSFIRASFRTRNKPDLFTWATGAPLKELAEGGAVADTSKIWDEGIASGDLTEEVRDYYTVDGKQYCVPANTSYWVMFYNKRVFAEHGITPPKTWQQMMVAAEMLKAAGVTPFYQTPILFSFVWFQQLMIGTDPQLYDDLNTGRADYTDPRVMKIMRRWKSMVDKGYFNNPGDQTAPESLLKSGKIAMLPMGTFFNTTLTANGMKAGKDYAMFVVPNVDPELPKTNVVFETGPLCALADAPDLKASEKYMRWWIKQGPQDTWANSRGDTSANPKVEIDDPRLNRLARQVEGPGSTLHNRYYEAAPPQIRSAALDAFGAFVVDPSGYRDQLADVQHTADAYWAKYGGEE